MLSRLPICRLADGRATPRANATGSPPPAAKAAPSTRRGGRMVRPRFGPAIADSATHSTAGPIRWTHLVGGDGKRRCETPPPDAPNELAPCVSFAASVATRNGANSWRVFLPPRHAEGCAFAIGGGKALRLSPATLHRRAGAWRGAIVRAHNFFRGADAALTPSATLRLPLRRRCEPSS